MWRRTCVRACMCALAQRCTVPYHRPRTHRKPALWPSTVTTFSPRAWRRRERQPPAHAPLDNHECRSTRQTHSDAVGPRLLVLTENHTRSLPVPRPVRCGAGDGRRKTAHIGRPPSCAPVLHSTSAPMAERAASACSLWSATVQEHATVLYPHNYAPPTPVTFQTRVGARPAALWSKTS